MSGYEKHHHYDLFYKLTKHPVYMVTITKSGCTYLKNLMYFLEHGVLHPLGNRIHDDESKLPRAGRDDAEILAKTPYKFIVLRDPARRFYSLYFDKIYGRHAGAMSWFQEEVAPSIGLDLRREIDVDSHRKNAVKLLRWIGRNLRGETEVRKDFHWRRQNAKYGRVSGLEPRVLMLEGLSESLPRLLSPVFPDAVELMKKVSSTNASRKPIAVSDFLNAEVMDVVSKVYKADYKLIADSKAIIQ